VPSTAHQAICVRLWDWSETSQTVSLLTRDIGLIRCVAKGAKREKGPFSGGLELCTRGEAQIIVKTTGAMSTLTSWDLTEPNRGLRLSLSAFRHAAYAVDLAQHLVPEGESHPVLFDALADVLGELSDADEPRHGVALLGFQYAALSDAGYRPGLPEAESDGYVFDPEAGRVGPDRGRGGSWRMRPETVAVLADLERGRPAQVSEAAVRASRLLAAYGAELFGRRLSSEQGLFPDS